MNRCRAPKPYILDNLRNFNGMRNCCTKYRNSDVRAWASWCECALCASYTDEIVSKIKVSQLIVGVFVIGRVVNVGGNDFIIIMHISCARSMSDGLCAQSGAAHVASNRSSLWRVRAGSNCVSKNVSCTENVTDEFKCVYTHTRTHSTHLS